MLFSCSTPHDVIIKTKIVNVTPPEVLYKPLEKPVLTGDKNNDLVNYLFDLNKAFEQCNADRTLLRQFVQHKNGLVK
jgi:hypothetical protein